jgi:putative ABC transport system ATP-binding protein
VALIELTEIGKTYNGAHVPVRALDAVSLTIDEREFVALMGPSGSGKTTLLGVLGAMTPPTTGRVDVDGINVYGLDAERRADFRREYLGFVFQQLHLMPYLTAAENVMLPLVAARTPSAVQRGRALAALDRVRLADKADRLPHTLSGGEQQRISIARAVVNEPPVLLADEPTGCLDRRNGEAVMELFARLRASGLTIFMVTHDPAIAAHADRVVTLQDGRLEDTAVRAALSA